MALQHRQVPSRSKEEEHGPSESAAHLRPKNPRQLLQASEVPPWLATNPFLLTGYRSVYGSVPLCVESLLFMHNETVNIYSHLIPAAIALVSNYFLNLHWRERYPTASMADQLAIHAYLTSSVICFGISSTYHTLDCHSQNLSSLWNRFDYAAIILQTVGSFISGIYVTFYCMRDLQRLYWTMTGVLGLLSTIIVVHPRFQGRKWRKVRVATFVATGLSGLFPVVHASFIYPYEEWNQRAAIGYYVVEGMTLLVGTIFYATHFPESWKPVTFDIWGASHQIFHVLVVISSVIHLRALFSVFDWIYKNPVCPDWAS